MLNENQYKYLLQKGILNLTNEEKSQMNEYEQSNLLPPSKDELKWAQEIMGEFHTGGNVNKQKYYSQKINGEKSKYDQARILLERDRMLKKGGNIKYPLMYETDTKTSEDVDNEFHFAWNNAYERVTGEKAPNTGPGAKKLHDFAESYIANFDESDIRRSAIELGLWNPKTQDWSDFLQSGKGKQLQRFTKDVENRKKNERLKKIWSGEEKSGGALLADMPGSNFLVNFTAPVTKEYAKRNYEDIQGIIDLGVPLSVDMVSSLGGLAGLGGKVLRTKNAFNIAKQADDFIAPLVTETAHTLLNDKDVKDAVVDAVFGVATNKLAPKAVESITQKNKRDLGGKGLSRVSEKQLIKNKINLMADDVAPINAKLKDDSLFRDIDGGTNLHRPKDDITIHSEEPRYQTLIESGNTIPFDDIKKQQKYGKFLRDTPLDKPIKINKEDVVGIFKHPKETALKVKDFFGKTNVHGGKDHFYKDTDLYKEAQRLGIKPKESIFNSIYRNIRNNDVSNALYINSLGKPEIGGMGVQGLSMMIPGYQYKYGSTDKRSEEDKLIEKYFGKKK